MMSRPMAKQQEGAQAPSSQRKLTKGKHKLQLIFIGVV
jgi:hypothetical protein